MTRGRWSLLRALALLAAVALAMALLWPAACPLGIAHAQSLLSGLLGLSGWLIRGISQVVAASLGLVSGTVTTLAGAVVDVTALLSATTQCSGRLCINLDLVAKTHPDLPDANAKVLLWSPKIANTSAGNEYDPSTKDWESVRENYQQFDGPFIQSYIAGRRRK